MHLQNTLRQITLSFYLLEINHFLLANFFYSQNKVVDLEKFTTAEKTKCLKKIFGVYGYLALSITTDNDLPFVSDVFSKFMQENRTSIDVLLY